MAVVIEAITIVVRRDAVRRAFRGNEAAFEALAPNRSGRKDSHLHAVGFMDHRDAAAFVTRALEPRGLAWARGEEAIDLTLVDQFTGLQHYTPWLEVGQYPVEGGAVTAAWLEGTEPGALSTHAGWHLQGYMGLARTPIDEIGTWQEVPSDHPGQLAILNPETGEKRYTVRNTVRETPAPAPAEEVLRAFFDSLPMARETARAAILARRAPSANRAAPDLRAEVARLAQLLPLVQELGRTVGPYDVRLHFTEGYILTALGRQHEAEAPLRRAHALAPEHAEVAGELMATLAELGKISDAIAVGREALPRLARNAAVPHQLAILLHSIGEHGEALEVLQSLLEARPEHEAAKQLMRRIEALS